MKTTALTTILFCFATTAFAQTNAPPKLTTQNLDKWIDFIEAKPPELNWQKVRWHKDLEAGILEARKLKRPVLLWTMNGHPCGET